MKIFGFPFELLYLCSSITYVFENLMKKRKKKTGSRRGVQWVTLCISTAMVLVLLGIIVFSVQTSRNLSAWVKENLTVTVMLSDDVSVNEAKRLCRDLYHRPYARNIDYVSKEQALKEQTEAMGSDPSEFLGANPFVATLELQLKSDYANRDSLMWIIYELQKNPKVTDVAFQEDLMDNVNKNLGRMNMVLLCLAVLLTFVSFSLINNTVRLSVYSRRFLIHTMKLVGASWGFIRGPFIRQAVVVGIIAAVLAIIVLGGGVYALYTFEPNIMNIITWRELTITAVAVLLFGLIITFICTWISVNRFLKMTAGELYKY
jgi:cell division transport system permease protein